MYWLVFVVEIDKDGRLMQEQQDCQDDMNVMADMDVMLRKMLMTVVTLFRFSAWREDSLVIHRGSVLFSISGGRSSRAYYPIPMLEYIPTSEMALQLEKN